MCSRARLLLPTRTISHAFSADAEPVDKMGFAHTSRPPIQAIFSSEHAAQGSPTRGPQLQITIP